MKTSLLRKALCWLVLCPCLSVSFGSAATRYVWQESPSPAPPFTNWATAARTIQEAVDAAETGDEVVVTNGVYANGVNAILVSGRIMNCRVVVNKAVVVRSVNGPEVTSIQGRQDPENVSVNGVLRCVYLAPGAVLNGFTLTNGATTFYINGFPAEDFGGGVYCGATNSVVSNCNFIGNSAVISGGGVCGGTLYNCLLAQNSARVLGGGAYRSTLNNCTVTGNSAWEGGGAAESLLNNCILYYNTARGEGPNYSQSTLKYCCTTPLPTNGMGNIVLEPQLASASHLSADSSCREAGSKAYAIGADIDGEGWANPPSIGCDEYWVGAVTGPLSVQIEAALTNIGVGYAADFRAVIAGRTSASTWDFGDGSQVSNRPYISHAWTAPGSYPVVLRAWNQDHPEGVSATVTVHVIEAPVHYVSAGSTSPVWPFASWATAARTIQEAVDAAVSGDEIVVSSGVYATGGKAIRGSLTNRVAVDKPVVVRSVNGPEVTIIQGPTRCVYLTNGAVLSGFTLTKGTTLDNGGGVWCESVSAVVSNCILTGNSASIGGGAFGGTLINCAVFNNSAGEYGGGVAESRLINCTVTANTASIWGGGSYNGTLNNCIIYHNTARDGTDNYFGGRFNYCCTTPTPSLSVSTIILDPQLASASHLSAASPCRGAGSPAYATGADIDGEAWANPPSIGCDEYLAGAITGPLTVGITATATNASVGQAVDFRTLIGGRPSASRWDFGDGVVVSNRPYISHAWSTPGKYPVVLQAWNEDQPEGVTATVTIEVMGPVHYVSANSASPAWPFTSWATAARTIQEAVDAAPPGSKILVTNGVYASGGKAIYRTMTNRVAVNKPVVVRSVNGPEVTIIEGYQAPKYTNGSGAIRCAYLANGAVLSGFTLTKGATVSSSYYSPEAAGGGVFCDWLSGGVVSNCTITGNAAGYMGGGAYGGTLNSCVITGNRASYGGGASSSTLTNCTLTGNSARQGGGANSCSLNNCILYYNTADEGSNYSWGNLNYCCTSPLPTNGVGNISQEPQLASFSHLSATSPCRGAGSLDYATGTDIDGETWANPPSMGCDEYRSGAITGPLTAAVVATWTNVAVGYAVDFPALIEGHASASAWDFGDGVVVSNRPYASHSWNTPGTYPVVLRVWNEDHPNGVSATVTVQVTGPMHYVTAQSTAPAWPFTSWATAARTIQEAVDAAGTGGEIVVSNGVYGIGGKAILGTMTNRVAVDKPLLLRSVNGPKFTTIQGYQVPGVTNGDGSTRCVYLGNNAVLSGFTLTDGATRTTGDSSAEKSGGGVWCESENVVVNNCVIIGNTAFEFGGGAYQGTLINCVLTKNTASLGGGAFSGTLKNCTVTENSASSRGGGVGFGTVNNCILYYNRATNGPNYYGGILARCCTTPLPDYSAGSFTNAPLFVDFENGNLRLQSTSLCINAGNADVVGETDLDGVPRIVGGAVDMGAYEYQSPASALSYAWLQQYGLALDGSADEIDLDHDGLTTAQEWRCGTNPTNALSALRVLAPSRIGSGVQISWSSASGVPYVLERSTNLGGSPAFVMVATNLPGLPGTTSYYDSNVADAPQLFYRVRVAP